MPLASMKLKDLVRKLRACKTAQEERDFINKECALIRTAFKESDSENHSRNVAKLLYIHLLGYPAHFGQLECLKLIASPRYTDKRIGYLGAMLLLDERQDVHIMITNSMKNDINHQSQYVQSLALCALGTIGSQEMSRDLAQEVEGLLKAPNTYIRKKATLCAVRILKKVPELMEMFVPSTRSLLAEKNHGVLLGAVTLIEEMCSANSDSIPHFRKFVPNLIRILKNLIMSSFSPEHDVGGVCDPFLQVQILRVLRSLAIGDRETSDALNDVLAQVATNTDSNKNAGQAILYETVLTIMSINSESGLRVLGVNILGRFLLSSDRNIRYIALNTLLFTVKVDYNAVQRHRATVLDCLKETDISIRRRALELSFALINEGNVRVMVKEILVFLQTAEPEFKSYITANVISTAEKFAPDKRWHVDTVLNVLVSAGSYIRDDLVADIVRLISSTKELQPYAVYKLYQALKRDSTHTSLVKVSTWCVGEFADLLLQRNLEEEEVEEVTEDEIVNLLECLLHTPGIPQRSGDYIINALMKLTTRLSSTILPRIQAIIKKYKTSLNVELQQRAVEYDTIAVKHTALKSGLLERMPPMKVPEAGKVANGPVEGEDSKDTNSEQKVQQFKLDQPEKLPAQEASLLDLLDDTPIETPPTILTAPATSSESSNLLDLLGDITTSAAPSVSQPLSSGGGGAALLDLMGSSQPNDVGSSPSDSSVPSTTAFEKNGLRIVFSYQKDPSVPNKCIITATSTNFTQFPMTDYLFQVAVPKSFQMQLLSPSGNIIPPNATGTVTQCIEIVQTQNNPLRMRIRLSYSVNGTPALEQAEVNSFPSQLM